VVLLDLVVEVLASPDADRFRGTPRAIPQPAFTVAGDDCLAIRLAAVNDDVLGPAMALQRLFQEALRRPQITMFAEPELDRVADAVDGSKQTLPVAWQLIARMRLFQSCCAVNGGNGIARILNLIAIVLA